MNVRASSFRSDSVVIPGCMSHAQRRRQMAVVHVVTVHPCHAVCTESRGGVVH